LAQTLKKGESPEQPPGYEDRSRIPNQLIGKIRITSSAIPVTQNK